MCFCYVLTGWGEGKEESGGRPRVTRSVEPAVGAKTARVSRGEKDLMAISALFTDQTIVQVDSQGDT